MFVLNFQISFRFLNKAKKNVNDSVEIKNFNATKKC